MKNLKLKLEYEGRTVVKQEGNSMKDFDNVLSELRVKFDGKKRSRND